MPETPDFPPANQSVDPTDIDIETLLQSLRRKEGSWVEWGNQCQSLQKAGYTPQTIFEQTGFEPIHQNQIIVAAQVYASILSLGLSDITQTHFGRKGSDILYELRVLTQAERAAAAELVVERSLNLDEAKELVKALKAVSRLPDLPAGFTREPGDAVAYQCWRLARQQSDLQERSRLIARGLRFATSASARKAIEQLLTDFTVTPATPAPKLPIYRLETDEHLPRILPVVGKLPLTRSDLQAVPLIEEIAPFGMVQATGPSAWVAVPGWQVILAAEDPIALLSDSQSLPVPLPGLPEEVLLIIDRAERNWDPRHYFLIDQTHQLQIYCAETQPESTILGRLLVVMRAKKILDENYTKELWQLDE